MAAENKRYTGYEYKKITAGLERLSFLLDGYENFGWEQDENFTETGHSGEKEKHTVLLRRDRKMVNKMELTRLQRNFEACIEEIDALEKAKTSRAAAASLTVAMLGTAFMAGSVFAITADTPHILLCIILSIPGIIGWILPFFVHRRVQRIETEKLTPLIEEKYDEIYEICNKGSRLSS